MRAAIVIDGVVQNVITLDQISDYSGPGTIIALGENQPVNPGDLYANGQFTTPPAVPVYKVLAPGRFLSLFTDGEYAHAKARETTTLARVWDYLYLVREGVEHPSINADTQTALDALQAVGSITAERKAAIIADWPRA